MACSLNVCDHIVATDSCRVIIMVTDTILRVNGVEIISPLCIETYFTYLEHYNAPYPYNLALKTH